ncbi:MAG: type I-E CRISPR-associated protein Cas6/Cse3/CasE, partial [Desulfovibrionales bacterium]
NGQFIAVSQRMPKDERNVWNIQVKEYDPKLKAGDRIFFSLRINAVRKTRNVQGKQVRHDIVQDYRKRLLEEGKRESHLPSRTVLAQQASLDWLKTREDEIGFVVEQETLLVESYQRQQIRKNIKARPIILSVIDMKGFAKVIDPEKARTTLMQGVGCAKGLGCGMMLIRRA